MFDDTTFDKLIDDRVPTGLGGRWYGVYPALVSDLNDPEAQGRVKVRLPWSPDTGGSFYEAWARIATLMGGNNRGSWFIPDVNDEVVIAFEGGDVRCPCVIGGLWNGNDTPPESMDGAGRNFKKVLRSRNGVKITLNDQDGQEELILETPGGQTVTMKDGPGSVEIVDSNGNSVKLESTGITVNASANVTINAGAKVQVSAGIVSVSAGISKFSGVVQCDTLISNTVVSATYTPGAGNMW
jgi:uncharacterized protein involved in type VI secretion and phage assembly